MYRLFQLIILTSGIPMSASVAVAPASFVQNSQESAIQKFDQLLGEIPKAHFFSTEAMRKLLQKYSNGELAEIYLDLVTIRENTFAGSSKQLDYIVTAGGPSSGKSTYLESSFEKDPLKRAYIDPDRSCLLKMERTYKKDIALGKSPQASYEHWREASNFLANYFLAYALKEGFAIAHGSTMATPFAKKALDSIRYLYGYKTTMLHVTCDPSTRLESEKKRREGGIVQCTDQDFEEKQKVFFSILSDYISSVDCVKFLYRGSMESITEAAVVEKGMLKVQDEQAFQELKKTHDASMGEGFAEKIFSTFDRI